MVIENYMTEYDRKENTEKEYIQAKLAKKTKKKTGCPAHLLSLS